MIFADSAYVVPDRMEIYKGKEDSDIVDLNAGPNDVVRNIDQMLSGQPKHRLIVTDRLYSSVLLPTILLSKRLYHVGTLMTNRLGTCKEILYTMSKRSARTSRGTYCIAQSNVYP